MKIDAIIADDEPLAREGIRNILVNEPDITVVAECADGNATLKAVKELRPDLLFLDIQMPLLDGFGVLANLPIETQPCVIFITAFNEHALRAFEVHALDYLLKPFSPARFKSALQRAREQLRAGPPSKLSQELVSLLADLRAAAKDEPRVTVKSSDQILFVKPADISRIESAGNYLVLHCGKARHTIRETMASLESRLEPFGFLRISRSDIINLNCVSRLQPGIKAGDFVVILKDETRLGMTCSLTEFQRRMQTL